MCSSSGRPFVHADFYGVFSCIYVSNLADGREDVLSIAHKRMKNLPSACTNGLSDDEHMMLETCRRHQE